MCGVLNHSPQEIALGDEINTLCILCGQNISQFEPIHRSGDGEIVHQACFNDLNDEDAHFYEAPGEEVA